MASLYRALDSSRSEIRLLDIQPSSQHAAPIVCKLRHAYLSERPKYECLSYVWGNTIGGSNITLDGVSFHVFENCEAAIKRLRSQNNVRTVWIDAICINQKDEAEKGFQVGLMRDIYERAHQVCVWLGELGDGTLTGVKSIQGKLFAMGWQSWKTGRKFGRPTLSARENFGSSIGWQNRAALLEEEEMGEIREILDRPWFTRVWIMQEAVLAKKILVMCGPESMSWERIGAVTQGKRTVNRHPKVFGMAVDPRQAFPDDTYQSICQFREQMRNRDSEFSLYNMLYNFRHLHCTDPRDRIFGFLGLTPAAKERLGIPVDYTSPTDKVYTQFARTVIQATRSLDILSCVREWRDPSAPPPQRTATAHSLIEQSRYHDTHALLTDSPGTATRRGWARLPAGWERTQEPGMPIKYRNHYDGSGDHSMSPLEGAGPIPASSIADQRILPEGWTKTWNNLGQTRVSFSPANSNQHDADRLENLKRRNFHHLPSWVPNWAAQMAWDPAPLLDWADSTPQYWAAGLSSTAEVLPSPSNSILKVKGIIFDVLEFLAPPWHPSSNLIGPFSRKGISELEAWEALATAYDNPCPYGQTANGRANALWRTLIADPPGNPAPESDALYIDTWYDRVGWQRPLPDLTSKGIWEAAELEGERSQLHADMVGHYTQLRAETQAYKEWVAKASLKELLKDSISAAAEVPKRYGEYLRRIRSVCAHRALGVTNKGYIGLVPWNAGEGDFVCILQGGKTPFVLRPIVSEGSEVFKVVGEAYIYGIMGGEAVPDNGVGWREFDLA